MYKKTYLALTLIIIALLFFSVNSYSQNDGKVPKKTPEELARNIADTLRTELQLSDTQYDQVYDIFLSHINKVREDRQKYGKEDTEGRQNARKERRKNLKAELENVLSGDQMAKLKELHKERKNRKHKTGTKSK